MASGPALLQSWVPQEPERVLAWQPQEQPGQAQVLWELQEQPGQAQVLGELQEQRLEQVPRQLAWPQASWRPL